MSLVDQFDNGGSESRTAVPQASDAPAFGADCLLLGAFVIACGLPLFHVLGIPTSAPLAIAYVGSVLVLVALVPRAVWLLHWGRPIPLRVRRITITSLLYQLPMLLVSMLAVSVGMQRVFLGVAIMGFAAAVLISIAGERFRDYPAPPRLIATRLVATVCTPVIVLGLTQVFPDAASVMFGWAIPVPIAAAGAIGASRGFAHQMELRDRLSAHS